VTDYRLLDGRELAAGIRADLLGRVDAIADGDPTAAPALAIVTDGTHEAAAIYAASLERAARAIGAGTSRIVAGGASGTSAEAVVEGLNNDPRVVGIVIAQPFGDAGAGRRLVEHVDPAKDVDGATPTSAGRLARGEPAFVPATALAVIAVLEAYDIPVAGARAVIVGRSAVVGRPVGSLLLARDATVVVCHRATRDLAAETRRADVLVVAAGVAGLVTAEMVSPGTVVVDCGINPVPGGITGDVVFDAVAPLASAITPVPGGIGPVTPMMVLRQLVEAAERRRAGRTSVAG
jgi:methylenetetrahydrofolate dehydrogenase (NADP+) / methenyltetrahydrofolate cyclohydrolase